MNITGVFAKLTRMLNFSAHSTSNSVDEKIAALHREATSLKVVDLPKAVKLLQEAADLDTRHSQWGDAARMVRLPVFLQRVGRFDEAMAEFSRLIDRVPAYVKATYAQASKAEQSAAIHQQCGVIYDKMRVACKRAKRTDLVESCTTKIDVHANAWFDLQASIEAEQQRKAAAYDAKRIARKTASR